MPELWLHIFAYPIGSASAAASLLTAHVGSNCIDVDTSMVAAPGVWYCMDGIWNLFVDELCYAYRKLKLEYNLYWGM